jgi:DNA adenine methylase
VAAIKKVGECRMPFNAPLRYPGGKRKLANFMKLVLEYNELVGAHYVEPYAGGAAIALDLLLEGYMSHIHINDVSKSVYAFWFSALHETEALCDLIQSTDVTINEWHKQRAIQERADQKDLLALGFSTFFLNRTNRSGIIKGGVIGGKAQDSLYKLNARYNKENLVNRIRYIANFRGQISIYNEDAADFVRTVVAKLPFHALVYLDPPYFAKGKRLYENYYELQDHEEIANLVGKISQNWIITYDNVPEVRRLYASYRCLTYYFNYSAASRYRGSEIMFFCNGLEIPPVRSPVLVGKRYLSDTQECLS